MTTQLKTFVSSKALFPAYTNHNFKYFSWTFSTQKQVSSECVCVCVKSNFFFLLCKKYYEEIGSNLNTKPTEKSSFFISYKRGGNHLWSFYNYKQEGITETIFGFQDDNTFQGKQVRAAPTPQGQWCLLKSIFRLTKSSPGGQVWQLLRPSQWCPLFSFWPS